MSRLARERGPVLANWVCWLTILARHRTGRWDVLGRRTARNNATEKVHTSDLGQTISSPTTTTSLWQSTACPVHDRNSSWIDCAAAHSASAQLLVEGRRLRHHRFGKVGAQRPCVVAVPAGAHRSHMWRFSQVAHVSVPEELTCHATPAWQLRDPMLRGGFLLKARLYTRVDPEHKYCATSRLRLSCTNICRACLCTTPETGACQTTQHVAQREQTGGALVCGLPVRDLVVPEPGHDPLQLPGDFPAHRCIQNCFSVQI